MDNELNENDRYIGTRYNSKVFTYVDGDDYCANESFIVIELPFSSQWC